MSSFFPGGSCWTLVLVYRQLCNALPVLNFLKIPLLGKFDEVAMLAVFWELFSVPDLPKQLIWYLPMSHCKALVLLGDWHCGPMLFHSLIWPWLSLLLLMVCQCWSGVVSVDILSGVSSEDGSGGSMDAGHFSSSSKYYFQSCKLFCQPVGYVSNQPSLSFKLSGCSTEHLYPASFLVMLYMYVCLALSRFSALLLVLPNFPQTISYHTCFSSLCS